jgi:hypothetical protein
MRDDMPYYVGMGHGSRINDPHTTVILPKRELRLIVEENMTEQSALILERTLTEQYGLLINGSGILENRIHGGHASPRGMLGKKHSYETRQLISLGNLGKVRTSEQRVNYRGAKTLDHVEKIRQANIGRKDDGRYEKMAITKKGKPWTQARRDAQNLRNKG